MSVINVPRLQKPDDASNSQITSWSYVLICCRQFFKVLQKLYGISNLNLKGQELKCHYVLFHTNPKTCKFYFIPNMMTLVAWKQSYGCFPEEFDFAQLENSMKFVLLKFYLVCFGSMAVQILLYILALHFLSSGTFERSHCFTAT